jgi:hypothetical protein
MPISDVVAEIDKEIERLEAAKSLLTSTNGTRPYNKKKHHTMSASARKRISIAQKKRWAAYNKSK